MTAGIPRKIPNNSHPTIVPTPNISLYYRRSLLLPLVLSVAGFVVVEMLPNPTPWLGQSWLASVADTLAWTGMFAAIPYALFVLIVWVFFRPEGVHAHRLMAALAPVIIAVSLALIMAVIGVVSGDWRGALGGAALLGGFALAVGTVHCIIVIGVVELVAAFVSRGESLS